MNALTLWKTALLKIFKPSILMRLGLALAAIVLPALVAMTSSVILAEMIKGRAATINQAGALRMQTYRIAALMLRSTPPQSQAMQHAVAEFESRLERLDATLAAPFKSDDGLYAAYREVQTVWRNGMRPTVSGYLNAARPASPATAKGQAAAGAALDYWQQTEGFVARINHLVSALERDTESKIELLRLIQGLALLLSLGVVYLTVYLMRNEVLAPLQHLLASAESARRGDFSTRVPHTGDDELGQLGQAFNIMAADLSQRYQDLQSSIAEKAADLEISNRSLELVYRSITRISDTLGSDATYTRLLQDVKSTTDVTSVTLCLEHGQDDKRFAPVSRLSSETDPPSLCEYSTCAQCSADGHVRLRQMQLGEHGLFQVLSFPLQDCEKKYGVLLLQYATDKELTPKQAQIVETISRHIGIAIGAARHSAESRRLALLEERTAIAQELHDSLAQSLSYLKIQMTLLQSELSSQQSTPAQVGEIMKELREGLSGAYRQLRELLTTFRLKMDGRGLDPALQDTVAEFGAKGQLDIRLENRLAAGVLSANEEINVLQIVREALSNVVRHAGATRAEVSLDSTARGTVVVRIDDDGKGFDPQRRPQHHYGIIIMQDRARNLGGEFEVAAGPEGGTRIELSFLPSANRKPEIEISPWKQAQ